MSTEVAQSQYNITIKVQVKPEYYPFPNHVALLSFLISVQRTCKEHYKIYLLESFRRLHNSGEVLSTIQAVARPQKGVAMCIIGKPVQKGQSSILKTGAPFTGSMKPTVFLCVGKFWRVFRMTSSPPQSRVFSKANELSIMIQLKQRKICCAYAESMHHIFLQTHSCLFSQTPSSLK